MGKKDKKKGKGAEKTASKTEKKALNKLKKDLAAKGEGDIERLIAEFQEKGKSCTVGEELCPQPSPRSGFSFCAHPEKDELILFGGEFFNGSTTVMFNDLYLYNIKKEQWSLVHTIEKPPPRCSHQAVILPQNGVEMWVFGGEFASPTRSNFYHYKDLWVFHFADKRWEQVKVSGAPSARSGHRMVASQKKLIVFGGFSESFRDYKYFNDVYIFDLEMYVWSKIEPVGKGPAPRSGCQMLPLIDGRIFVYGGYTRERLKKDVDKGVVYTDLFYLCLDERTDPPKWKWVQAKSCGIQPSSRSGFSIALAANNRALAFGGVFDEDCDEENMESVFLNDLYLLELESGRWMPVSFSSKIGKESRKRRRRAKEEEEYCEEEVIQTLGKANLIDGSKADVQTYDDGIFSVKIGPQATSSLASNVASMSSDCTAATDIFLPKPRMNASMVVKHGILYMYGGICEEGDRQLTLSDFYSLDIHKLDEWNTIVPFSTAALEWIESEESSSDEEESDVAMNADGDEDYSDEDMDTL